MTNCIIFTKAFQYDRDKRSDTFIHYRKIYSFSGYFPSRFLIPVSKNSLGNFNTLAHINTAAVLRHSLPNWLRSDKSIWTQKIQTPPYCSFFMWNYGMVSTIKKTVTFNTTRSSKLVTLVPVININCDLYKTQLNFNPKLNKR